ncbi:tRNA pseudouridine(55) synthase TruB [Actinomyces minihominis]|uniref:tRNA pseudouridine(55) synthase TruB n=1 Tax=Actinomyces minihominis TaxID=2002838 RepID=UPI001F5D5CF5|nr:tRNA pseudouridine(55) synthase TruB [Actinomyces minihominis]
MSGTNPQAGILLVDKPGGMTSHDVVSRGRRLAGTRRVGHAGTLDPMATGVLVLGINGGTKLLQYVTGAPKTYLGTVRLGVTTVSDDAEGEVIASPGCPPLTGLDLERAVADYRGDIMQVPTRVSAIKIGGKRAHALVRDGEEVVIPPRPVTIHRLVILGAPRITQVAVNDDGKMVPVVDFDIEVRCSSGTYIRALARDIGADLGVGGHLTALRRTSNGPWDIGQCHSLESLFELRERDEPLPVIPLSTAAQTLFPTVVVTGRARERFRHGQAPRPEDVVDYGDAGSGNPKFPLIRALVSEESRDTVLGLVELAEPTSLELRTVTVFAAV